MAEAGVLTNWSGTRPAELDAVVLSGIMRGRKHRSRGIEAASGKVQQVSRAQTQVDNINTLTLHAASKLSHEFNPRRPHVSSNENLGGPLPGRGVLQHELGKTNTDCMSNLGVELFGNKSANVIGLKDIFEGSHEVEA